MGIFFSQKIFWNNDTETYAQQPMSPLGSYNNHNGVNTAI